MVGVYYDVNQVGDEIPPTYCCQGWVTVLMVGVIVDITNSMNVFVNNEPQYLINFKTPSSYSGAIPTDINSGWSFVKNVLMNANGVGIAEFFVDNNTFVTAICDVFAQPFKMVILQDRKKKAYRF